MKKIFHGERLIFISIILFLLIWLAPSVFSSTGNVFSTKAIKTLESLLNASGQLATIEFGTNSEIIDNSTDAYISFKFSGTPSTVGLLLAASSSTGDQDVCIYFGDDGSDQAQSLCWDDGASNFLFSNNVRLNAGSLSTKDDVGLVLGTGSDANLLWETADSDANELILYMPEGGATNVPVFVIGDATINNANLGFFNGITDPSVAVISDDGTDYFRLSVSDAGAWQWNFSTTPVSSSTTNTVTNKVVITINGTPYYLLASTSGT